SPDTDKATHALWLLAGLGALDDKILLAADGCWNRLAEPNILILPQVLGLYEHLLPRSKEVQERFLESNVGIHVRFQVALSLGEWDDDRIVPILAKIALRDSDNKWIRAAVMTSVPNRAGMLISALLKMDGGLTSETNQGRFTLLQELSVLV